MKESKREVFLSGMQVGMPICLGYFAVAFTLGITAKQAGLTAWQAMLATLLTNASAGGYAAFTVIAANGTYFEMAVMELVANARYLLMSAALSQKFSPKTGLLHRMIVGFDVTDEIFGAEISVEGKLNPWYAYGMMTVAIPGWSFGTFFGVLMGNVLPANVTTALGVGLYGMFLAIIIPPAKTNKIIAGLIVVSMVASFVFQKMEAFAKIPSGTKIIILTVVISGIAAVLFPIKEDVKGEEEHGA